MPLIAPSFLASNFLRLQDECDMVNSSVADWFHLDVMDGRFVPNISFGMPIIEHIRKATTKPCDVHLMIEEPGRYAQDFKNAGADHLTVHFEACPNLHRNIQQIKQLGMKAGVAINPHTPVHFLSEIIQDVDIVLVMSVNPGFGGQTFIPHTMDKIRALKHLILEKSSHALIEVDGGVDLANASALLHCGANVLVAGSAIFKSADPKKYIAQLKQI
jgi:ribulose-phosphate 3-epimerase